MKNRVKRHSVVQPQDESIKLIPLTKGQNAIVDAADYDFLMRRNWCASWSETTKSFYAKSFDKTTGKLIYMHRTLFGESHPEVDHRNRNTLDNRRENIRGCASSSNKHNIPKRRTNKSGYKGVSWCKERGLWVAHIQLQGKSIYIGGYHSREDAYSAYCARAVPAVGDFFHG